MFWSIFLVISEAGILELEKTYIPISSFNDRISCENAIKSQSELILSFDETNVSVACIKTDEKVKFGLVAKPENNSSELLVKLDSIEGNENRELIFSLSSQGSPEITDQFKTDTFTKQKKYIHSNVVCSFPATLKNIGHESLALHFTSNLFAIVNYKKTEEIYLDFQLSGTQRTDHILITVLPSESTSRLTGSNSFHPFKFATYDEAKDFVDLGGCNLSDNPILVDFGVFEKFRFEGDDDFGSDSRYLHQYINFEILKENAE
jgi:hypothetical protein